MSVEHQQKRSSADTSETLNATLRSETDASNGTHSGSRRAFMNVIHSRADLGVHLFVDGPVVIGRDPDCTLRLHDFRVSRRHAEIVPADDGTYTLHDLRSTNGTRVNGRPINEHPLTDGEKIYVGDSVLRFSLGDELEERFHNEVAALVAYDPLTGLPSKRRFDQALELTLDAAKKSKISLALLMMDMDGVKAINDTHGHLFGAHVIGETGRLIAGVLGNHGKACRFGGDEFTAFLPSTDLPAALAVAEQIRSAVESANMQRNGIELKPTISIGVACFQGAGEELNELLERADAALYRAKALGKNCVAE